MEALVAYCKEYELFKTAHKKLKKYHQTTTLEDKHINTFYIHRGKPVKIVTSIKNETETYDKAKNGDFVITGPLGEKYVVKSINMPLFYNLIDGILYTRQIHRTVAKITPDIFRKLQLPNPLSFKTSWGAPMILKPRDYLVKDGDSYYRVDNKAFQMTYSFEKP